MNKEKWLWELIVYRERLGNKIIYEVRPRNTLFGIPYGYSIGYPFARWFRTFEEAEEHLTSLKKEGKYIVYPDVDKC